MLEDIYFGEYDLIPNSPKVLLSSLCQTKKNVEKIDSFKKVPSYFGSFYHQPPSKKKCKKILY